MADDLKDVLEALLSLLASSGPVKDRPALRELAEVKGPDAVRSLIDPKYAVDGSIGIGTVADVPWFMISPPGSNGSAQRGAYVVYLFAADGDAVYLSLNQGTEKVKRGLAPLKKRAIDLRESAGPQSDLLTSIDLRSDNTRPRKYQAANAYARAYKRGSVPSDADLQDDLKRFLGLLGSVEKIAAGFDPALEPIHLG
jgi:hypothetical protein